MPLKNNWAAGETLAASDINALANAANAATAAKAVVPEDYGAVGDGTTNDTTAMQNWLSAITAGNRRGLLQSGKTYKITAALTASTANARAPMSRQIRPAVSRSARAAARSPRCAAAVPRTSSVGPT